MANCDTDHVEAKCKSRYLEYCQNTNIRCTLMDNKIVDHSYVVGAWPIDAAPTTSSFST